jgi:GMP synthase-like glutamine amidotransferase
VGKSERGWGVGAQAYVYDNDSGLENAASFVFHQDQVEQIPPGARVIGSSEICPIGALEYDFPALSVQYHPEFTGDFTRALIDRYDGNVLSSEIAGSARESLTRLSVDNAPVGRWAADFFRHHINT